MAHQHLGQLTREMREGIAANARTKVYFQVSRDDAATLGREVRPELAAHDLAHLPVHTAAVRLCHDGQTSSAFTVTTEALPPNIPDRQRTSGRRHGSASAFPESRPRLGSPSISVTPVRRPTAASASRSRPGVRFHLRAYLHFYLRIYLRI